MHIHPLLRTLVLGLIGITSPNIYAQSCNAFSPSAVAGVALQAEPVTADATRPPNVTTGPTLVSHCIVNGKVGDRKGVDGKDYHTGF
jgi:hypothetical protein